MTATTDPLTRPTTGEKVVLVHPVFRGSSVAPEDVNEFEELARSSGAEIVGLIQGRRNAPDPKYLIGRGKLEEIHHLRQAAEADLVIFNHELAPAQARNLERFLACRVIDRTDLILDIFAQRARTFEGKLQVELAQLAHLSTRLVRGWGHLERQRGGIGLRGPGETQLEVDRRLIRQRIKSIHKRLAKVRSQRQQGRRARRRASLPTIALVGYTNAGKSTLFNRMTTADVIVADQLFATLDPTLRRIELPTVGAAVLADTVGFIRHLPHDLVEAFRATLEETQSADLLLHIVDASDPARQNKMDEVQAVLIQIGADHVKQLVVYNKVDLLAGTKAHIDYDAHKKPKRVWLSSLHQQAVPLLLEALQCLLSDDIETYHFCLLPNAGRFRAACYEQGEVLLEKQLDNGGCELKVRMKRADFYSMSQ